MGSTKPVLGEGDWTAGVVHGAETPYGDPSRWYGYFEEPGEYSSKDFDTEDEAFAFIVGFVSGRGKGKVHT